MDTTIHGGGAFRVRVTALGVVLSLGALACGCRMLSGVDSATKAVVAAGPAIETTMASIEQTRHAMDETTVGLGQRMLVTYKTLPGSPRYQATVTNWDSTPNPPGSFALAIVAGARKIDVTPLGQKMKDKTP